MTLVPCRECQREISSEAPSCPHCGVPEPRGKLTAHGGAPIASAKISKPRALGRFVRSRLKGLLLILAVLVVLGFIANMIGDAKKSPEQRARRVLPPLTAAEKAQREAEKAQRDEEAAKTRLRSSATGEGVAACRIAVEDRLKSPSTAKFPFDHRVKVDDANRTAYIFGSVDSQNSFGAMLRTQFGCCELRHDGSRWNVEKVVFESR